MKPPKVEKDSEIVQMLEKWEIKVGTAARDFGKDLALSEKMKVAVATSMMPQNIQEMIFQNAESIVDYKTFKDKVATLVESRVAAEHAPMDVGAVGGGGDQQWEPLEEEAELGWIGGGKQGNCHNCGGFGHFARECPSKGKGKGNQPFVKGQPKGMGKHQGQMQAPWQTWNGGKNGGGKGSGKQGKGYQGTCWTCGEVGHKSAECKHGGARVNNVEDENKEQEIGGVVWDVGAVDRVEVHPTVWLKNRFQGFQVEPERTKMDFGSVMKVVAPRKGKNNGRHAQCEELVEINNIETKRTRKIKGKVTIDSGAGESVWPSHHLGGPDESGLTSVGFLAANGSKMPNYGPKKVVFENEGKTRSMKFHCTDVKKPLGAVSRICEKGNIVQFGPSEDQCFIQNIVTQEKIPMKLEKGTYVMEVDFVVNEDVEVNRNAGFTRPV